MPTDDDFVAAAWEAAPVFGLEPEDISVLAQSENVVCDLTMPDASHLVMRLHRPGYNTVDELDSEVVWVRALGDAGVPVPTAVPTLDGPHYTSVAIGDEVRHVGVVEWVDGQPLGSAIGSNDDVTPSYAQIGALAAAIRIHSNAWTVPSGFSRRKWDVEGLVGDNPLWGRFWEVDALTADQQTLFSRSRNKLRDELGALSTGSDRYGLIHADLHLGNLMAHDDALTIIDFDDAGYGWFAHELAVALHAVLDEPEYDRCKASLLEGYRSVFPLDATEEALIDTFVTVRCLMIVGWLDARRELGVYEHFGDLAQQAAAACHRYLAH